MRIVSLLPSTTEIVCALGLADDLVAVTHECDYPPAVQGKPAITSSTLPHSGLSSAEIDTIVSSQVRDRLSIYHLDEQLLAAVQPDLLLTQELCDVCAVAFGQVQHAVREVSGGGAGAPRILSLEPTTLDGILATIERVGEATGQVAAAAELVASLRARVAAVAARTRDVAYRPRVACFEWLDPIFAPGHWVPEMVQLAGGTPAIGAAGVPSERVTWATVQAAQPEIIVLTVCGFDVERTLSEAAATLPHFAGWDDLPAVQQGRVYAVDGNAYFSRPGPRIVDGLEMLAGIVQPDLCGDVPPAGAVVPFTGQAVG